MNVYTLIREQIEKQIHSVHVFALANKKLLAIHVHAIDFLRFIRIFIWFNPFNIWITSEKWKSC